jgi:ribonuclease HII
MALEEIGNNEGLKRLVERIKKRFPDYNFDIPVGYDTTHKAPYLCKSNTQTYFDNDGNVFCATRYKLTDEKNPHAWTWATCNALISTLDEQKVYEEQQDDIF